MKRIDLSQCGAMSWRDRNNQMTRLPPPPTSHAICKKEKRHTWHTWARLQSSKSKHLLLLLLLLLLLPANVLHRNNDDDATASTRSNHRDSPIWSGAAPSSKGAEEAERIAN